MKIYTLGETVLDIIFKNNGVEQAIPGGAMLNTSISLGRLCVPVSFVSFIGKDEVGGMVKSFLTKNGVDTNYLISDPLAKTSLALAFLDKKFDAKYSFYKEVFSVDDRVNVPFEKGDVLYFGSSFSLNSDYAGFVDRLLESAKSKGVRLMYDPNIRGELKNDDVGYSRSLKHLKKSNIVKGSDEDFQKLWQLTSGKEVWQVLREYGVEMFIYTKGANGVEIFTEDLFANRSVPKLNVISTIGAGDNFSAGILFTLYKTCAGNTEKLVVDRKKIGMLMENGVLFASNVCESTENYISEEFAKEIKG